MNGRAADARPELWAGVECSFTRIGDGWRDQLRETGHYQRPKDLERIAALGIRTLRYPILWEQVEAEGWDWIAARLALCRRLGLQPVAGLVHHGAGPASTHLLDWDFPRRLAGHAAAAAHRFPDISLWNPVNEPLTTARFGCLYGVWHPHLRDESAFLRATVIQCRAVQRAMRAIRAVIPGAQLVQTEDLSRTFATGPLAAQAEYENGRRWLSLDLLCGWVQPGHPWRTRLEAAGVPPRELDALAEGDAAPDRIGANHYVTSERFLDHRTGAYPPALRGGNGRQSYADTEAVRAPLPAGLTGWEPRLRELWARYRRPIAITEVQLGGECEAEQLRWFAEAWGAALRMRADGIPLLAVTAWAVLGAVDWDSLMVQRSGRREPGAWQTVDGRVVPRLLAGALRQLAAGEMLSHPCLAEPGWWRRAERLGRVDRLSA